MRCARCGASVIAGSSSCYRCGSELVEPEFAVARPAQAPTPVRAPPQAQARTPTKTPDRRPWAAVGFAALSLLFLADVVLLDDAPGFYIFPPAFLALAALAWTGRGRVACISIASLCLALGLLAAAGGGYLVGGLMAVGSAGTLAGLVLRIPTPALMAPGVERRA